MKVSTMRKHIPKLDRRAFALGLTALASERILSASAMAAARSAGRRTGGAGAEPIIVSGASGHLGELTTEALLARGVVPSRLILVSRTPEKLQSYAQRGASVRFGDFTRPDSLSTAFAGGKRLLLISIGRSSMPRPQAHKNAIDAAISQGVMHIAYTSWIALGHGDRTGLGADHYATEDSLRKSGVGWTMLRNSSYMETLIPQAAVMVAAGRAEVRPHVARGYVAREDCAAAAAAVLATPWHDGKAYDITGPQLIGPREIAETASAVTGRPILIEAAPEGAAGSAARTGAAPRPAIGGPAVAVVSDDVQRLTGRPAIGLEAFFEHHRREIEGAAAAKRHPGMPAVRE
jgi:NAD(P)H dehydrogenase (quinone)